jgi:hypothetical protein
MKWIAGNQRQRLIGSTVQNPSLLGLDDLAESDAVYVTPASSYELDDIAILQFAQTPKEGVAVPGKGDITHFSRERSSGDMPNSQRKNLRRDSVSDHCGEMNSGDVDSSDYRSSFYRRHFFRRRKRLVRRAAGRGGISFQDLLARPSLIMICLNDHETAVSEDREPSDQQCTFNPSKRLHLPRRHWCPSFRAITARASQPLEACPTPSGAGALRFETVEPRRPFELRV